MTDEHGGQNPGDPVDAPQETLSWATCIGAAAGLAVGVTLAVLLAAMVHGEGPGREAAEVVWEITAPLLGILGVIAGSFTFRRWFQGRVWLAVGIGLVLVALGVYLVVCVVGFPWRRPPAV